MNSKREVVLLQSDKANGEDVQAAGDGPVAVTVAVPIPQNDHNGGLSDEASISSDSDEDDELGQKELCCCIFLKIQSRRGASAGFNLAEYQLDAVIKAIRSVGKSLLLPWIADHSYEVSALATASAYHGAVDHGKSVHHQASEKLNILNVAPVKSARAASLYSLTRTLLFSQSRDNSNYSSDLLNLKAFIDHFRHTLQSDWAVCFVVNSKFRNKADPNSSSFDDSFLPDSSLLRTDNDLDEQPVLVVKANGAISRMRVSDLSNDCHDSVHTLLMAVENSRSGARQSDDQGAKTAFNIRSASAGLPESGYLPLLHFEEAALPGIRALSCPSARLHHSCAIAASADIDATCATSFEERFGLSANSTLIIAAGRYWHPFTKDAVDETSGALTEIVRSVCADLSVEEIDWLMQQQRRQLELMAAYRYFTGIYAPLKIPWKPSYHVGCPHVFPALYFLNLKNEKALSWIFPAWLQSFTAISPMMLYTPQVIHRSFSSKASLPNHILLILRKDRMLSPQSVTENNLFQNLEVLFAPANISKEQSAENVRAIAPQHVLHRQEPPATTSPLLASKSTVPKFTSIDFSTLHKSSNKPSAQWALSKTCICSVVEEEYFRATSSSIDRFEANQHMMLYLKVPDRRTWLTRCQRVKECGDESPLLSEWPLPLSGLRFTMLKELLEACSELFSFALKYHEQKADERLVVKAQFNSISNRLSTLSSKLEHVCKSQNATFSRPKYDENAPFLKSSHEGDSSALTVVDENIDEVERVVHCVEAAFSVAESQNADIKAALCASEAENRIEKANYLQLSKTSMELLAAIESAAQFGKNIDKSLETVGSNLSDKSSNKGNQVHILWDSKTASPPDIPASRKSSNNHVFVHRTFENDECVVTVALECVVPNDRNEDIEVIADMLHYAIRECSSHKRYLLLKNSDADENSMKGLQNYYHSRLMSVSRIWLYYWGA
eukprot:gene13299-13411_t